MNRPKNAIAFFIFFIVLLTIYSNSFNCSWHLDDFHNITDNPNVHLQSLSWPEIKKSFSGIRENSINRPLSFLTFALNYYVHQDRVAGYHVVNLFIHFLTTVFLFLTIRLAIAAARTCKFNKDNEFKIALLAALIWACHPIQVTAVTYIVQRMASLAGLFSIITLYFYLLGRKEKTGKRFARFSISFLAAIMAFGSKENTVILPAVILAAELILIQGLTKDTLRKNYKAIVLFTVLVGIFLAGQNVEQIMAGYQQRNFSLAERLLTQPRVIVKYLSLLFWPIDQNFALLHDLEYSKSFFSPPGTFLSIAALFTGFSLALTKAKRFPLIAFGVIFFFLTHLVESTFIPLEMIFEHRNYLPSMFVFLLPAIIILRVYQCLSRSKTLQCLYLIVSVLIFLSICHTTYSRNYDFKDELNLWLDNNHKYPDLIRPYISLGNAYYQEGEYKKAVGITKIGLDRSVNKPNGKADTVKLYYNMGLQFLAMNQLDYAEVFTQEAVKIDRSSPEFFMLLAKINSDQGQYRQALNYIEKAITIDDKQARYHYIKALLLVRANLNNEAITTAKIALTMDPGNKLPLYIIGEAYRSNLNFIKSIEYYKNYLACSPESLAARIALLEIYHLLDMSVLRDGIYKEITSQLKGRNFEEAVESFNNSFDLLERRRDTNVREAARAVLEK